LHISSLTIPVVDTLIEVGLVGQKPGFYNRLIGKGRIARIWPTEELVGLFRNAGFSPLDVGYHQDRLNVIVRDTDPDDERNIDVEYEPTEETERMEAMLSRYNNLLRATFIDIPVLETRRIDFDDDGKPATVVVSQHDKNVRRIFNRGSFDKGGRFFGGWWQRCPKEWRSRIFLNDQPTNEVDYSGLHTVMLYALEGVNYWKEVGEDPYSIPVPDFLEGASQTRKVAKLLLLMLLNARSTEAAYNAFRNKAAADTPEKHLTNAQLAEIHQALAEKHPRIAGQFGRDVGIRLMNLDSRITEIILSEFTARSVPALSVHDSYIVPVGWEDTLIEAMSTAFETIMGIPLGPHSAKAMKEQSERVEDLEGQMMTWMPYDGLAVSQRDVVYKNRCYPVKSDRYVSDLKVFNEWRYANHSLDL